MLKQDSPSSDEYIHSKELAAFRMIVPAKQIVHPGLFIIEISTIPERTALAQSVCQRTNGTQQLAPYIVFVFYHGRSATVKNVHDINLKVMKIDVHCVVELHFGWPALRTVEEVQFVLMGHFIWQNSPRNPLPQEPSGSSG